MFRRLYLVLGALLATAGSAGAQQEPSFQGQSLSSLIADLKAAAPMTRNAAAYSIAGIGPAAASAVPALIEALNDDNAAVRFPVCVALREIGPAASAALPALEQALDDGNEDVAAMAKKAIKAIKQE